MKVYLNFNFVFLIVNTFYVLLLRWFSLDYICNTPERMWDISLAPVIIITVVLYASIIFISYFITRPFDTVIQNTQRGFTEPTSEDKKKCSTSYKRMLNLTIISNTLGFFVGQVLSLIINIVSHNTEFNPTRFILITIQAVAFGCISAITTINTLDFQLLKYRKMLNITSINEFNENKTLKLTFRLVITITFALFFIGINMGTVTYGLGYAYVTQGMIENVQFIYVKKLVSCFVICALCCFYPLIIQIGSLAIRIRGTTRSLETIIADDKKTHRIHVNMFDDFGRMVTTMNKLMDSYQFKIDALTKQLENNSANTTTSEESVSTEE